jgi:hypothetical protein
VLARTLEITYRKPVFAGQRARVVLQAYEHAGRLVAMGAFLPEPAVGPVDLAQIARAHCFIRMTFA